MDVILLITLFVLLLAALPTWPYSASGRTWFHGPQASWDAGITYSSRIQGGSTMRFSRGFRAALVALLALISAGSLSVAHADSGSIQIWELKGGWIIGASGGGGTLYFHGRRYPLSIGGLSAGLVFGASETKLYGSVSNIRHPSDVAGVYGGAGAGAALLVGARAIVLRNEKGAVLTLSGRQVGLIANADLSGLAISLR
jgi:Protein of unknown function (DUF3309)